MTDTAPLPTAGLPYATAHVNNVDIRYLDQGTGPAILLLHGFPDFSYGWHRLLDPLAQAGYRVVAPDLRGHGGSSRPAEAESYTYFHIIGDIVALMNQLEIDDAVVVGHDMGAYVAMNMALIVPQRVRAVVSLSIPLRKRPPRPPMAILDSVFGPNFYQIRFQQQGPPDEDLDANVETFLPGILVGLSADTTHPVSSLVLEEGTAFSALFPAPDSLPQWLTRDECDAYVATYRATGFSGGLASYRNIDRNWELMGPWENETVKAPAMYVTGDDDIAYKIGKRAGTLDEMAEVVPGLRRTVVIENTGHWLALEQPAQLATELLTFIAEL